MNNKDFLVCYKSDKLGVHNTIQKKCICGCEMDINEKKCPVCGIAIPKSKLININRNSAILKRYEIIDNGVEASFIYYNLLSKGFELYETELMRFSMNRETCDVSITGDHIFKKLKDNENLISFLKKIEPGFFDFVEACLKTFQYEYAVTNFTSLNESQIKNFLTIYMNYKAIIPKILPYKIMYYGSTLNLKKYYPDIDFCNSESVKKMGIVLELLCTWDIKNEKYIETMIEIENKAAERDKRLLLEIVHQIFDLAHVNKVKYDDIIKVFSILYNKEISLNDFIRIFQNSRENFFFKIYEFRNNYKKLNHSKIDWSSIEKLDRKIVGTVIVKKDMKEKMKLKKEAIDTIYEILNKDPIKALDMLL